MMFRGYLIIRFDSYGSNTGLEELKYRGNEPFILLGFVKDNMFLFWLEHDYSNRFLSI
ncbi:hypothetical protein ISN45_At03g039840 [Arabidopsis thaliana x Arabidopsis arenosa]|uniref:Uncharacterized protein n=2 Tax=Arabidopsis TaxID=3701 RepID=A0A8T2FQH1_ARASU|nr:hypothetical protein ISN45_At03g039840 [Arabidopsis thaliana x Arabidopsis arenosa]KAG7633601.1 hypothetical protein ISN44_As03g038890 [Arabidopsis suecica]